MRPSYLDFQESLAYALNERFFTLFFRFVISKPNGRNLHLKMRNCQHRCEFIEKLRKSWRQNCPISRRNTEKLLIYYTILKMSLKQLKSDPIPEWVNTKFLECLKQGPKRRKSKVKISADFDPRFLEFLKNVYFLKKRCQVHHMLQHVMT